jgi:hypothetical protein
MFSFFYFIVVGIPKDLPGVKGKKIVAADLDRIKKDNNKAVQKSIKIV